MKNDHLRKIVASALMAALTLVMTMVLRVPSPTQGYMNLGDAAVLLCGWFLGPWWGAAAAGIGSALSDVLSGYLYYVPGTLLIKGTMAMLAAFLTGALRKKLKKPLIPYLTGAVAAELLMVAGYFGYSYLLLGKTLAPALYSALGNLIQGGCAAVLGVLLKAGLYAAYKHE